MFLHEGLYEVVVVAVSGGEVDECVGREMA